MELYWISIVLIAVVMLIGAYKFLKIGKELKAKNNGVSIQHQRDKKRNKKSVTFYLAGGEDRLNKGSGAKISWYEALRAAQDAW